MEKFRLTCRTPEDAIRSYGRRADGAPSPAGRLAGYLHDRAIRAIAESGPIDRVEFFYAVRASLRDTSRAAVVDAFDRLHRICYRNLLAVEETVRQFSPAERRIHGADIREALDRIRRIDRTYEYFVERIFRSSPPDPETSDAVALACALAHDPSFVAGIVRAAMWDETDGWKPLANADFFISGAESYGDFLLEWIVPLVKLGLGRARKASTVTVR